MTDTGGRRGSALLQRLAWAGGIAVVGSAAMIGITLPVTAFGDDEAPRRNTSSAAPAADAPGTIEKAAAPEQRGEGRDPLTPDEEAAAVKAALAGDRPLRMSSEDVRGNAGEPQLLTVELAEADGPERTAEVRFYDYRDNTLITKTVELGTGEIADSSSVRGAQPPPSRLEAAEAAKLMLAARLADGVREDYRAATGRALTEPGQLEVQGMTYLARPGAQGALAECGEHRCVQLFTRAKNGPWIDTRHLVIDLSDRTVHHA